MECGVLIRTKNGLEINKCVLFCVEEYNMVPTATFLQFERKYPKNKKGNFGAGLVYCVCTKATKNSRYVNTKEIGAHEY